MSKSFNRRQFLKLSATSGALLSVSPIASQLAHAITLPNASKTPNVVLIVTDEERHWSRIESLLPTNQLASFQRLIAGRMELRNQGVRFHNYFTSTAPCSPARSVLFTGHHTVDNGVVDNMDFDTQGSLSADVPTMADVLGQAGYYCAYKGKVHLARDEDLETADDMAQRYGFLDWQGPFRTGDSEGPLSGTMRDDDIATYAKNWLESTGVKLKNQKPFLLTVNFINPHDIMMVDVDGQKGNSQLPQGPKLISGDYDPNTMNAFPLSSIPKRKPYLYWWNPQKPANANGNNGYSVDTMGPRPEALDEWASMLSGGFGNISLDDNDTISIRVYKDNNRPNLGQREIKAPLWQVYLNYYLNCIIDNDNAVQKVLKAIKDNGFAENTLVIMTADHGELALSHMGSSRFYEAAKTSGYESLETALAQPPVIMPLRQKGPFVYHENSQLPFIVARLSNKIGSVVKQLLPTIDIDIKTLASSVDVLPTLMYLAGKNKTWYTQTFSASLRQLNMLDHLPGVSLHNVLRNPSQYSSAQWTDGEHGRNWVLFTADTLASSLDADYAYLAIWGKCSGASMDLSKRGCMRGLFDGKNKYARYFSPEDYALNGANYANADYAGLSAAGKYGQQLQVFQHDGGKGDLEMYNSAADSTTPVSTLNKLLYNAMKQELAHIDSAPLTVQRVLDGDVVDACVKN